MFADDLGHRPVRTVRVDNPVIAVFIDTESARVPPPEDTVGAAFRHHAVKVGIIPRLKVEGLLAGAHQAHVPGMYAGLGPQYRQGRIRPASILKSKVPRFDFFPIADAAVGFRFENIHRPGEVREIIEDSRVIQVGRVARHGHAEADRMVGVQGTHEPTGLGILLVQQRVEEPAVGGNHAVPVALSRNHVRRVVGNPAVRITRHRAAPLFLRILQAAVALDDPRFPLRIEGVPFRTAELGLPGEVIGEYGIVFRQPVIFNEFPQGIAGKVHRRARSQ
ncbi:MAG: hypothetical protein BWY09_02511 [Candidatus Hydrogenedentes bacterium ADurb.Bin179]|nr:MAG: hypothetical protein BWY09_02511 [Candidatus Hydrogenedentes bacterium ADurb.Bin179]